jgi:hypothetical protein
VSSTRPGRWARFPLRRRDSCPPPWSSGAIAAAVGYFATWGIPSITSLVLSVVLYVVAGRLGLVRAVGVAHTRTVEALPESQPVH